MTSFTPPADASGASTRLVDPKLLRLFDLLHTTRSVTQAAARLGQSQPTVSIWLAQLRTLFNDPLFVRSSTGMLPTPRATSLLPAVREVLQGLRALSEQQQAFDPARSERSFRICMTDASHVTLLPRLLEHIRAAAPGVRLEALRADAAQAQDLESGAADLALGYLPWLEGPGFYQQTLYDQDWVCLTRAGHVAQGGRLDLAAYRREAHVVVASGTGQALLEAALKRARVERRVALTLPGFLGLAPILASTDLVATLPRHIGQTLASLGGLAVHECPLAVSGFSVRQYWHGRFHQDGANRWLRELCARLFLGQARLPPR